MSAPLANATKNVIFSFLNLFLSFVIGIVISIIVARGLGPDVLGKYSFITFLLSLFSTIFGLGLPSTITKYVSEYLGKNDKNSLSKILKLCLKISFLLSILAAITFLLCFLFFGPIHNPIQSTSLAIITLLLIFPLLMNNVLRGVFSGTQSFSYLLTTSTFALILTLIGTILVLLLHWGLYGILLLSLITNTITLFLYLYKYKKDLLVPGKLEGGDYTNFFDFYKYASSVAIISIIDLIVWQYSEVVFLGIYRAPKEVAYYTLPFNIAFTAMTMLPGAILQTLMPILSKLHGQADSEGIKKAYFVVTKLNYLLIVPMCFIFGILAKEIIFTLYGTTYAPAAKILPILIVSSGFAFLSTSGSLVLYSIRKQTIILKYMIFTAIVNITLDVLLIPKLGIYGAVIGNVTAQTISSLCTITFTLKEIKGTINFLTLLKPIAASLLMGLVILLVTHLFHNMTGLGLSIIFGVLTYLIFLPLFHFFNPQDQELLLKIGEFLPKKIKRLFIGIIQRLVPAK